MPEFEIEFPNIQEDESLRQEQEKLLKSKLKNTANGILSKIIVFIYTYKANSTADLCELLTDYYKIPFDKGNLNRYIKQLLDSGILGSHTSFYAMSHNSDPLLEAIREKHNEFLKKIPSQFQKKFTNINYYYITEYGKKFVPWASEVIGFKFKEKQ